MGRLVNIIKFIPLDKPFMAKDLNKRANGAQLRLLEQKGFIERTKRSGPDDLWTWRATAKLKQRMNDAHAKILQ